MCEDLNLPDALKAAGFEQQDIPGLPEGVTAFVGAGVPPEPKPADPWEGFEVISTYTRKQAIEDGVLVDLSSEKADGETKLLVLEAGFKLPIAITATAFADSVLAGTTETPDGEFVFPSGQSCKGRLWDVLMVLRYSIRAANRKGDTDRVHFKVDVDAKGDGHHQTVNLWCQCGPGDNGEPVLTIMLEGED
ncbi:MAG: DUF6573 family protein [Phycisphaerae bacterium]|jgi:hypothetical protein